MGGTFFVARGEGLFAKSARHQDFLRPRAVTMLTLSLIGKESNRVDEVAAGLIGTLDDTPANYFGAVTCATLAVAGSTAWEAIPAEQARVLTLPGPAPELLALSRSGWRSRSAP
jgi:hypothetical protein